jgi:hypothetical protein
MEIHNIDRNRGNRTTGEEGYFKLARDFKAIFANWNRKPWFIPPNSLIQESAYQRGDDHEKRLPSRWNTRVLGVHTSSSVAHACSAVLINDGAEKCGKYFGQQFFLQLLVLLCRHRLRPRATTGAKIGIRGQKYSTPNASVRPSITVVATTATEKLLRLRSNGARFCTNATDEPSVWSAISQIYPGL